MNGTEKRIHEYKIRFTDTEIIAISKLAHLDDRTVTDWIHNKLTLAVFGLIQKLNESDVKRHETDRGE